MKGIMKRLLVMMLALMLLTSIALPAAMAETKSASVYAGMKTTLVVYNKTTGVQESSSAYKWSSSNSKVASVTSSGVVTGKKAGTATITATSKSNSKIKVKTKIKVLKNKVSNISAKPSKSAASYKNFIVRLKSVEIVSPTRVDVEYYVAINFPGGWKARKIIYMSDAINLYDKSTGAFAKTIVGGTYQVTSKKISGFKARKGSSVQVIKVTYSGSQVHCADILLSNYNVYNSGNCKASLQYSYYK